MRRKRRGDKHKNNTKQRLTNKPCQQNYYISTRNTRRKIHRILFWTPAQVYFSPMGNSVLLFTDYEKHGANVPTQRPSCSLKREIQAGSEGSAWCSVMLFLPQPQSPDFHPGSASEMGERRRNTDTEESGHTAARVSSAVLSSHTMRMDLNWQGFREPSSSRTIWSAFLSQNLQTVFDHEVDAVNTAKIWQHISLLEPLHWWSNWLSVFIFLQPVPKAILTAPGQISTLSCLLGTPALTEK